MSTLHASSCLFCRIINKEIPSVAVFESTKAIAFMDIFPVSKGHLLIVPKYHASKMHELPNEYLADILIVAKNLMKASIKISGISDYNILQNNGKEAHQVI